MPIRLSKSELMLIRNMMGYGIQWIEEFISAHMTTDYSHVGGDPSHPRAGYISLVKKERRLVARTRRLIIKLQSNISE